MNVDQFFNVLAVISWAIVATIIIGLFIVRWLRGGFISAFLGLFSWNVFLIFFPIAFTLLALSVIFVPPTESGVVISFLAPRGYREQPMTSGRHWIIPVAEEVILYPIYQQTYTMSSNPLDGNEMGNDTITSRTSDGQEVFIDVSIIFAIDPEQVVNLHILWQDRYIEDLIRPLVRGVVRTEVAAFTVQEVNSIRRQDLERTLNEEFTELLANQGILLDRFLIRNISFTPEYAASVEEKQIAFEQQTESTYQAQVIRTLAQGRADEVIRLAEARASARLIEAQAESEALNLIAAVLENNDSLLTYRYIDKIAPNIGVMIVPQNQGLFLSVDDALQPPSPITAPQQNQTSLEEMTNATPETPTATPTPESP